MKRRNEDPSEQLVKVHVACPCGSSSDAWCVYGDGHGHCFSCGRHEPPPKSSIDDNVNENEVELVDTSNVRYEFYGQRSISKQTFEFYNAYTQFVDDEPYKVGFIYPNNAIQFRFIGEKKFLSEGPMSSAGLYGIDRFDPGSKDSITISEGNYDALASYEMLHGNSVCVAVKSATSAKKDCIKDYDYVNSFQRIILAFDNDEAGRIAAREVASLFDFNKVYHVTLNRYKDPNAYLEAGEADEFYSAWRGAKRYSPDNIISTRAEFARSLKEARDDLLATYPFTELTSALYGLYSGSVVLFKGLEGIGKTEIFRAMEYHILKTTNLKIGILHLEESNSVTLKALAGYELKVPATLPDSGVSDEEVLKAIDILNPTEDRLHIHSSFDVDDENGIVDNIRYLATAAECRVIFLDHISWLATGGDKDDDERRKLDRISQKLKLLAEELKICIVIISHVNDNGQTRGSRNIAKVANTVIDLTRDLVNGSLTTHFTVIKARLGGRTGPCGSAVFDRALGILREASPEDVIKVPQMMNNG